MKPGLGVTPGHQNGQLRSATCDLIQINVLWHRAYVVGLPFTR